MMKTTIKKIAALFILIPFFLIIGCGGGDEKDPILSSNIAPSVFITATPTSGPAPLVVDFIGSGVDIDGSITYLWDFNDETTSTAQNVTHTYTIQGSYTASLTVTDNNGAKAAKNIEINVSESLGPGHDRSEPVDINNPVTYEKTGDYYNGDFSLRITLLQTLRGEPAWNLIQATNQYNNAPQDGYEYILAEIYFEFLQSTMDSQYSISPYDFDSVSGAGIDYESVSITEPDPELNASMYAGATAQGWVALQTRIEDTAPLLSFGRDYRGRGGIWFKLY